MDWTQAVDAYCERTAPGLWAEPLNAVTNLGFILAALWLWPRVRGMPGGQGLTGLLFVIGLGSTLNHTFATRWAALADVIPIAAFVLAYLFLAGRDMLGLPRLAALAVCAAFIASLPLTVPVFALIPGIGTSAAYAPVPVLIVIVAALIARTSPETARRLAAGALMLTVSIVLRSLDAPLCPRWPPGTHFLWHLVNAAMLAFMVLTWRRHVLAGAGRAR